MFVFVLRIHTLTSDGNKPEEEEDKYKILTLARVFNTSHRARCTHIARLNVSDIINCI